MIIVNLSLRAVHGLRTAVEGVAEQLMGIQSK